MDYHRSDIAGAENYFTRVLSNADPSDICRHEQEDERPWEQV